MSSSRTELVEVTLPDLGEEAVQVVTWKKQPGDPVSTEEPLCLIAVGPAHAEVGSPADGAMATIVVAAGTSASSGATLAEIAVTVAEAEESTPEPEPLVTAPAAEESLPQPPLTPPPGREFTLAGFRSPAVRRLADVLGVDLDHVEATGRGGRITREDVLSHMKAGLEPAETPAEPVR